MLSKSKYLVVNNMPNVDLRSHRLGSKGWVDIGQIKDKIVDRLHPIYGGELSHLLKTPVEAIPKTSIFNKKPVGKEVRGVPLYVWGLPSRWGEEAPVASRRLRGARGER